MSDELEKKEISAGSIVQVEGLKRPVEVLEGPNKKGEYLVLVSGMNSWVAASKIRTLGNPSKKPSRKERGSYAGPSKGGTVAVDLHGMTRDEARGELDRALNKALMEGRDGLEVIHGKGSGALRDMVSQYLSGINAVKSFRLDQMNPGTTWVYF